MKKKIKQVFLDNLAQISANQSKAKISPVLALDYGEKFCGLAWSPDGVVALPLKVVPTANSREILTEIYAKKQCQKLIVGLPISGDGTENKTCQQIRNFAKSLTISNLEFVNERNSSQATFSGEKNERIDDLAAAKILEFWLQQ